MKIALAQINPTRGDITDNIQAHQKFIALAVTLKAKAVFFPELSLTGYEPELAKELVTTADDRRLNVFQELSDLHQITIGLELPTQADEDILITMVIFQPKQQRKTYSKQILHADELPYFTEGKEQVLLSFNEVRLAPAICFESLQPEHAEKAAELGASLYLASVAKPARGLVKASQHYPLMAQQYAMPVLMVNSVGFCDNFMSVGQSTVWDKQGKIIAQLDDASEGLLIFDTETEEVVKRKFDLRA